MNFTKIKTYIKFTTVDLVNDLLLPFDLSAKFGASLDNHRNFVVFHPNLGGQSFDHNITEMHIMSHNLTHNSSFLQKTIQALYLE